MGAGWVAGDVRGRALARRRLGPATAYRLARSADLETALRSLAGTPYGRLVGPGQGLSVAEHGLGAVLLWHLRVLAGWQPRSGVDQLRLLAGWFELANVDTLARRLTAAPATAVPATGAPANDEAFYQLGALSSAWPRLAASGTPEGLRAALAGTVWGDPGAATARAFTLGPRLAWADRIADRVPPAVPWAAGAVALLVARECTVGGRQLGGTLRARAAQLIGSAAMAATGLPELLRRLPASARWALSDVTAPEQLWRAEARWWSRLERDGFALLRRPSPAPSAAVGVAAVLAVDAWRVRAALESAARGGSAAEVLDVVG